MENAPRMMNGGPDTYNVWMAGSLVDGFGHRSITGAYQGFLFDNIQADFIYDEDISNEI